MVKQPGDVIILLGETLEELGSSEYLSVIHGQVAGLPPSLDLAQEKCLQDLCIHAAQEQLLSSAHDVAEGGLAIALAEACITGPDPGHWWARHLCRAALRVASL